MEDFEFKMPNLMPTKKSLKILGLIIIGLVAIFLVYQLYVWVVNYSTLSALDKTQSFTPKQVAQSQILAPINEAITLPTDQNGMYGVIKDVKALSQKNSFFKKARNGNILVIYSNQTIIYDIQNHSVVDISKTNLLK